MNQIRVTIEGREVKLHGIETGKPMLLDLKTRWTKPPARLQKQLWAIIRIAGTSYWSGIGQPRGYAPTHIILVEVKQPVLTGQLGGEWKVTGEINYPWDFEVATKANNNSIDDVLKRHWDV